MARLPYPGKAIRVGGEALKNRDSVAWRKSSFCESGACLEVAAVGEDIVVRNSQDPHGTTLRFSKPVWASFLEAVSAGDFHLRQPNRAGTD
ncbi:DUF397 domain-containing protein [Rhizocola hellebori]|uniref:DUF397 domain-containing protein n=1 Tax=Rhizocola hellebori TaxID=1392758 RepID=UPI0035709CB8